MCSSLLLLPTELLVDILLLTGPRQILCCESTCSTLRDIIQSSTRIQYQVALFSACKIDGSRNDLTAAHCLDILRQRERAWTELRWNDRLTIRWPFDSRIRRENILSNGVFLAHTSDGDESAGVTWGTLPSTDDPGRASGVEWHYRIADFRLYKMRADVGQDLLVWLSLVDDPNLGSLNFDVHLRTLSTNSAHPEALQATIRFALPEDLIFRLDQPPIVDIHSTHVGLLFLDPIAVNRGIFVLYDWKRAIRKDHPLPSTLQREWNSVAFLFENHILLPNTATGRLDLYTYSNEPNSLRHAASFGLPAVHPDWSLTNIVLSPNDGLSISPEPWHSVRLPIYRDDLEELIVVFIIDYDRTDETGVLLRTTRTFVTHVTTLLSYCDYGIHGPTAIPWESWGVKSTRLIYAQRDLRRHFVQGTRYATLLWLDSLGSALKLHDFNRRRMRKEAEAGSANNKPLRHNGSPFYRSETTVYGEICESTQPWAEALVTSLPYREVILGPICGWESFLMDDERIVGISDGGRALDILMM